MRHGQSLRAAVLASLLLAAPAGALRADDPLWVNYAGGEGPGKGKRVVLVSGDEEYRSEEALPQLGKILARHHGFDCTVLFAIDPATGQIAPNVNDNIPGLEALKRADVMVIATRWRNLDDEQMKHIAEYVEAGKPVVGLRTATHAFRIPKSRAYARYSSDGKEKGWEGGFGRLVLGETWISHHGRHGKESTRGVIAPGAQGSPLVRGCDDIWGPTDVYTVRLPLSGEASALVLGQVVEGMEPSDKPLAGKKNDPMMPVAWTRSYQVPGGKAGRAFTTTMGSSTDLASEGLRRLLVNACYWAAGLEDRIPERARADLVGEYRPRAFGFNGFEKGRRPADTAMK